MLCMDMVVAAHGFGCTRAHGIFLDQGLNLCPLEWQVDSQPLDHQGNPELEAALVLCLPEAPEAQQYTRKFKFVLVLG